MSEVSEGELILIPDREPCWKTRDRQLIPISQLKDSHLRNIALFLMGMGYSECIASQEIRVIWLAALSHEWQRRMYDRSTDIVRT
jgi:hypothetical protein